MIRVSFVTTSFPVTDGSVSGIFVKRLIESLPEGVFCEIIAPDALAPLKPAMLSGKNYVVKTFVYAPKRLQYLAHLPGGLPVTLSKNRKNYFLLPPFLIALFLAVFCSALRSDIVHANWSITGVLSGFAARLLRKPSLVTVRGEDMSRIERSAFYRWMMAICLRLNDRVVCVSSNICDELKAIFPVEREKIRSLSNGVDDAFLRVDRAIGSGRDGKLVLLAVGSLIPRKNIKTLIKSIGLMSERVRPILRLIGDGPDREELETLVNDMRLKNCVEFCGGVDPEQIARVYSESDLFVLASLSEGRANVLIEAMASGLPVVVSNIPANKELVDGSTRGLLFEPQDAKSLAEKLTLLIENRDMRLSLGLNARQYIIDQGLTWSCAGNNYFSIYEELLVR